MRITDNMRFSSTAHALQGNGQSVYELNNMASSGKKIARPEQGPAAYASIMDKKDRLARMASRQEAMGRAQDDLTMSESMLAAANDVIVRARVIAVDQADGGSTAEERAAAAKEVAQMRQELVGLANAKGSRGYLFGGSATDAPPFDIAGTFSGNTRAMQVEIADGFRSNVNVNGQDAFTNPAGVNAIKALADLETALNADDQVGITALIDSFDQAQQQLTLSRSEAGLVMERLGTSSAVIDSARVVAESARANEEEGDPTEVFSNLAQAQMAYERSLAVTRSILSMASSMQRF